MIAFESACILIFCLLPGLAAGFVMHRSDFCIAGGMFRDLFLFGAVFKLRTLLLLAASSMLLFEMARQFGILLIYPFPLFGSPSFANIIGGFIFGVGMVLAGGCVVGSLYKMGAGSILSAVACAGLIAGSAIYAEIHPWWAVVISESTFFKGKVSIPQILEIDPLPMVPVFTLISVLYFRRCFQLGLMSRPTYAAGSLQPWKTALPLSLIGLASCVFIGMPLGITTAYAKMAAYLESIFSSAHVSELAPILAAQSVLFLAGLLPGAWLGSVLLFQDLLLDEENDLWMLKLSSIISAVRYAPRPCSLL